jgi:hypothetical protein
MDTKEEQNRIIIIRIGVLFVIVNKKVDGYTWSFSRFDRCHILIFGSII